MERITRVRAGVLAAIFLLVLGFFAFKLYDLQIIQTGGKVDNTTTFTTITRVKAARGDILDRNGNVLVGNRASYNLTLNHYVLLSATGTNDHLYRLTQLCREQGIKYNEHFPISKERPFTYTLSEQNAAYQSYFQSFLAYMGNLDSDMEANVLIDQLRERYEFPETWTDEEARAVIGLRYELALRNCVSTMAQYVFLKDADDESLSEIVELNIPGMKVEASTEREYRTQNAAHILGFVGAMSPSQWEYYQTVGGYEMDAEVGQAGFEAAFEEYLHGVDGWRMDTVSADGTLISSEYLTEPKAGSNVEVTIDIELQRIAEEALEETFLALKAQEEGKDGADSEGGAVVVMDVNTGQVLVCASYPTYDPARYFEDYEQISTDPLSPLYNRALNATYPPGSTYKMAMVIAAIDSGIVDADTLIYDKGIYDEDGSEDDRYPEFEPTCLRYALTGGSHGEVNAAQALMVSCNYYFYDLGDKIRLSVMDNTGKALGLGEKTGVELYEDVGRRANEATKKALYEGDRSRWYQGDQILAAIGQSEHRFTPMQLCVYASTLANQGIRYKATFLNRIVSSDYRQLLRQSELEVLSRLNISDEAYMAYVEGMCMVTSEISGTAFATFRDYPIKVAAKTGTAETDKGSDRSDNGAFICFAPAYDPQIAISIYGEQAGHGNSLAVVAKEILDAYFEVGEVGEVIVNENQLT